MIELWFLLSGISYTLRELTHIWNVSDDYELRFNLPKWFYTTKKRLTKFHKLTFQVFTNGYHFFGNIPRIFLPFVLYFDASIYDVTSFYASFALWFLGRELTFFVLIKKK